MKHITNVITWGTSKRKEIFQNLKLAKTEKQTQKSKLLIVSSISYSCGFDAGYYSSASISIFYNQATKLEEFVFFFSP